MEKESLVVNGGQPREELPCRSEDSRSGQAGASGRTATIVVRVIALVLIGSIGIACFVKLVLFQDRLDFLQLRCQDNDARIRNYIDEQIAIRLEQVSTVQECYVVDQPTWCKRPNSLQHNPDSPLCLISVNSS